MTSKASTGLKPSMKNEGGSPKVKVKSHPTVDPSLTSPRCQTPNSRLEIPQQSLDALDRLQRLSVDDAVLIYEADRRIFKRQPEIDRLAVECFGEGWRHGS